MTRNSLRGGRLALAFLLACAPLVSSASAAWVRGSGHGSGYRSGGGHASGHSSGYAHGSGYRSGYAHGSGYRSGYGHGWGYGPGYGSYWGWSAWYPSYYPWWTSGVTVVESPIGSVVSYLPDGYTVFTVDGVTYYHCGNVYLQGCPGGYIVVAPPSASPNSQPTPAAETNSPAKAQLDTVSGTSEQTLGGAKGSQASSSGVVTISIPNANGGYTPVKLTKAQNGYIGPQGEFYGGHPTVEQLRALYGK